MLDQAKNFAKATVSTGYDAAATSIVLTTGHAARLPAVPFNATWWNSTDFPDASDDPNREIVRVTAIASETLTIIRAQESTAASTKNTAGKVYKLLAGQTAKLINVDLPTMFVRPQERDFDMRDYLAGDGVTDDTSALQAVINQIQTDQENGVLYFDNDEYIISGALQDTGRRNAQILLPTIGITDRQYSIKFMGHSTPACSPSGYEPIDLPKGTRIRSTLSAGSGSDPSVISGRGPAGGYLDETNYLHAEFENLIFITPPNPSYSCVNLRRFTSVRLKDCIIAAGTTMDAPRATQPTNASSYGLILPQYNSGICQILEGQVNVFGFYNGIRCGELMHAENIGIWWCWVGLEFPFSYHASLIQRLLIFWSHAGARWLGEHPVDIRQWDNEHTMTGESAWYATNYDILDPSNLARGEVVWLTVRASYGRESVFMISGGTNIQTRELGGATTPPPGFGPASISVPATFGLPTFGAGGGTVTLIQDTFTDTSGTVITAHTPEVGGAWVRFEGGTGDATIQSNVLSCPADAANAYGYQQNAGQANVHITGNFVLGTSGAGFSYDEIVFRYSDASNYWKASLTNNTTNNFTIIRREAGTDTTEQQTTKTFTVDTLIAFDITASGSSITASLDGGSTLNHTSSFNNTATRCGWRQYMGGAGNVLLESLLVESV